MQLIRPSRTVRSLVGINLGLFLGGVSAGLILGVPDQGMSVSDPSYYSVESLNFVNILWNNAQVTVLLFLTSLTLLWIIGAFLLVLNGYVLGTTILAARATGCSWLLIAMTTLPHGAIEVLAFALSSAVGVVLPLHVINYLRGTNDRLISRESNVETATYLTLSFVLIVVAAWIEATVSLSVAP